MVITSYVDNDLQEIKEKDIQIENIRAKHNNSEHKFDEERKTLKVVDLTFYSDTPWK